MSSRIKQCCGCRPGGGTGTTAVLVETRRHSSSVVEKRKLPTEAFRVAGPGGLCEVGEQRPQPRTILLRQRADALVVSCFGTGIDEPASSKRCSVERGLRVVKHSQETFPGRVVPGEHLGHVFAAGVQVFFEVGANEPIFVPKVGVERGLGYTRLLDQTIDADDVNALLVKEPAGCCQEPPPRSLFRLRRMFCSDSLLRGGCRIAHLFQCTGLVCLPCKRCDAADLARAGA